MNATRSLLSLGSNDLAGSLLSGSMQLARGFQKSSRMLSSTLGGGSSSGLRAVNAGLSGLGNMLKTVGSFFGPYGKALGEVTSQVLSAGQALVNLASQAAQLGTEFARLQLTSGGTGRETAQLSTLGNAFGFDAGSASRALSESLSKGGYGTGIGARYGLHDYGLLDDTDKAKNLLKATKTLWSIPEKDAYRLARSNPALEPLLQGRNLAKSSQNNLLNFDPMVKAQTFDPSFLKSAMEFQVSLSRLGESLKNVFVAVIKPLLPAMTEAFNSFATGLQGVASYLSSHQNQVKAGWLVLKGTFEIVFAELFSVIKAGAYGVMGLVQLMGGNLKGAKENFGIAAQSLLPSDQVRQGVTDLQRAWKLFNTPDAKHDMALDRHSEALEDHVRVLKEGIYGGGERARGAMPPTWRGMNAENWGHEVAKLGAFAM